MSLAPQAVPQAAGGLSGLSAAPQAAGVSAGLSAAPHAAGVSAGLSDAPQAVPQAAAALFSSAHPAMFANAMIVSSFVKWVSAGTIAFCGSNVTDRRMFHKNALFYYIGTFL